MEELEVPDRGLGGFQEFQDKFKLHPRCPGRQVQRARQCTTQREESEDRSTTREAWDRCSIEPRSQPKAKRGDFETIAPHPLAPTATAIAPRAAS